ncbi:MAG: type I CRISPR-associated protein Cas7, partial [Chloroflexota bacterium]
ASTNNRITSIHEPAAGELREEAVVNATAAVEGYVSAKLANDPAKGTGFSEDDLRMLWDALINLFEHDRSAARGKMATRRLIVYKHESDLGNAPAHKLFERVTVERKPGVVTPRNFTDYIVAVDSSSLPAGVELIEMV